MASDLSTEARFFRPSNVQSSVCHGLFPERRLLCTSLGFCEVGIRFSAERPTSHDQNRGARCQSEPSVGTHYQTSSISVPRPVPPENQEIKCTSSSGAAPIPTPVPRICTQSSQRLLHQHHTGKLGSPAVPKHQHLTQSWPWPSTSPREHEGVLVAEASHQ